jgi:hypothetical protein
MLSCSPWEDTIATPRVHGLYIEDAEEGGLNVSADEWQLLKPPFPCNPIPPTTDIHSLVEVTVCGSPSLKISRSKSL